jgi:hypothetical protein
MLPEPEEGIEAGGGQMPDVQRDRSIFGSAAEGCQKIVRCRVSPGLIKE